MTNFWRFQIGDGVWVRNWQQDQKQPNGYVVEQLHGMPIPHYIIKDIFIGSKWRISQIELSGKYITSKER